MRGMPILVALDEVTDWMGAWVVPEKGEHWYAIKVLAGYIEETGRNRKMLKSDQESAISREEGIRGRGCTRRISSGRVKVLGQQQRAYTSVARAAA